MKHITSMFVLCSFISILSSCKKDKENKTTSDAASGLLLSQHVIGDTSIPFGPIDEQDAYAFFLSNPADPNSHTLVDSVLVNNFPLEIDADSIGFLELEEVDMSSACNWRVVGNSNIPGFTFNFPVSYPAISGNHVDTIAKGNGVTFHYSFTDADSVVIQIASTQTGQTIDKTFPGNSTSQQFTASELQQLLLSSQAGNFKRLYTVNAMRSTNQPLAGRTFTFTKLTTSSHMTWVR